MDRVSCESGVIDHDSHGGVGSEIIDVPLGIIWIRVVPDVGEEENRAVVIGTERDIVDCPKPEIGFVLFEVDVEVLGDWWSWVGSDGIPGNSECKIILLNC
jgi:hypothetical protein